MPSCQTCGGEVPADARFCTYCGARAIPRDGSTNFTIVANQQSAAPPAAVVPQPIHSTASEQSIEPTPILKSGRIAWLITGLFGLASVASAIAGWVDAFAFLLVATVFVWPIVLLVWSSSPTRRRMARSSTIPALVAFGLVAVGFLSALSVMDPSVPGAFAIDPPSKTEIAYARFTEAHASTIDLTTAGAYSWVDRLQRGQATRSEYASGFNIQLELLRGAAEDLQELDAPSQRFESAHESLRSAMRDAITFMGAAADCGNDGPRCPEMNTLLPQIRSQLATYRSQRDAIVPPEPSLDTSQGTLTLTVVVESRMEDEAYVSLYLMDGLKAMQTATGECASRNSGEGRIYVGGLSNATRTCVVATPKEPEFLFGAEWYADATLPGARAGSDDIYVNSGGGAITLQVTIERDGTVTVSAE